MTNNELAQLAEDMASHLRKLSRRAAPAGVRLLLGKLAP
jgi:hypothetical protein